MIATNYAHLTYYEYVQEETRIKQALAKMLGRTFNDLTHVTIEELLHDIAVAQLEYDGSCMRTDVVNAKQFLYFYGDRP